MKSLPLILLTLAILLGCKPASSTKSGPSYPPPTRQLTPQEVVGVLAKTNVVSLSFALPDSVYVMPTVRWINSEFSSGLWQFQTELGISRWSAESNDCDKFAIATSFYAKWLNHSSPNRIQAALSVGELYYYRNADISQGHAINFFVVLVGDSLQAVFYEPQTRSIVELSKAERESVFFWKL